MRLYQRHRWGVVVAAFLLVMSGSASALAQVIWTNATASGFWSTGGNWSKGLEPTAAQTVLLPAVQPGSISLGTGEVASSLSIQDDYTLAAGDLTLTTGQISVGFDTAAVINSVLKGSAGLTKTGDGSLRLGGTNQYLNGTFIYSGTLIAQADSNFGAVPGAAATNLTINGGVLQLNSALTLHANRQIEIGPGGATINVNNTGNASFAGVIQDLQTGVGTLTLTATNTGIYVPQAQNTYAGGTRLVSGLTVPNVNSIGSASTDDLLSGPYGIGTLFFDGGSIRAPSLVTSQTIGNALQFNADPTFSAGATGTLNFTGPAVLFGDRKFIAQNGGAVIFTGNFSDGGTGASLTLDATSTAASKIVLAGVNTYTGASLIEAGILQLGNGGTTGSLSPSSAITVNGALVFNRSNTITQGVDFGSLTGTGTLTHAGSGTLVLANANSYAGGTTISGGMVAIGNNAAFGSGGITLSNSTLAGIRAADATPRTIANPLTLSGDATFGSAGTGDLLFSGNVANGNADRVLTILNSRTEFSGVISGPFSVTKAGPGLLALTNANTIQGNFSITGGTVKIEGTNGSLPQASRLILSNNSRLILSNATGANNTNRLSNTAFVEFVGGTFDFAHGAVAGTNFSETVDRLIISGSANTLVASQAATGQTSTLTFASLTRTAGTLNFTGEGLGANARNRVFIANQGTTNLSGFITYNGADYAAHDPVNGVHAAVYTDIDARGSVVPNTLGAAVRLQTAAGSGNITLAAAETFITTLLQNTTTPATINNAGQTLRTSGIMIAPGKAGLTIGTAVDSGFLNWNASGTHLDLINNSANPLTINSVIQNAATTISGTGQVVFAGANTYTGTTTVTDGTLTLSGNRTVDSATLTVGNVSDATGTVNLIGGNLSFPTSGAALFVGNGPRSTGVLNQSGGTLTFKGSTQIRLGNLSGRGVYNFSGGTLNSAATQEGIILAVSANSSAEFNLSGTAVLNLQASTLQVGAYNLAASNTTTVFNQTGGTAAVGTFSIAGSGIFSSGQNATVNWTGGTFSADSFASLAGSPNSTASMTIGGTAEVSLRAFPTARGAGSTATLTLDGGTLLPTQASSSFMSGLTNAYLTANGAKLNVASGKDITILQLLENAPAANGTLTKLGVGTLTLTGANSYSGGTTVSAGTLQIGPGGSVGTGPVTNNATFDVARADLNTGAISGIGTTTVTASGATLTANHLRQTGLTIGAGNTVTIAANGGDSGTSVVTNLSINATGKLDLTNNDLIVDNGNLTALTAKLASGLDITGSYGSGPGINGITSSTFANDPNFNTVLGIASNADLGYTSFSGQTVDANDVLIKYTYFGDADLNGVVDGATDFDLYITGLTSGGSLGGWLYGDFDYNGTVDSATDFDLYITGLSGQGGPLLTGGGGGPSITAVPEPSTLVLGTLGGIGLAAWCFRRRR